jgi:hypothetical protein
MWFAFLSAERNKSLLLIKEAKPLIFFLIKKTEAKKSSLAPHKLPASLSKLLMYFIFSNSLVRRSSSVLENRTTQTPYNCFLFSFLKPKFLKELVPVFSLMASV